MKCGNNSNDGQTRSTYQGRRVPSPSAAGSWHLWVLSTSYWHLTVFIHLFLQRSACPALTYIISAISLLPGSEPSSTYCCSCFHFVPAVVSSHNVRQLICLFCKLWLLKRDRQCRHPGKVLCNWECTHFSFLLDSCFGSFRYLWGLMFWLQPFYSVFYTIQNYLTAYAAAFRSFISLSMQLLLWDCTLSRHSRENVPG